MSLNKALAQVVRGVRISKGLSQEDLSTVDRSYLGRIEGGRAQVTVEVLNRIAVLLGVDVGLLVILATSVLEEEPSQVTIRRIDRQLSELDQGGPYSSIAEMLKAKRPPTGRDRKANAAENLAVAQRMRSEGASLAEIARALGLAKSTVHAYLKQDAL
jgi:transcriptional regulator with XRE-family HTH domain